MENRKELVKRGEVIESETAIAPIADRNIIAIANEAEARVKAFLIIKQVALSHTNAHDWVNESGKPYLQSSGAEKIAGVFGVSWHLFEPTIEKLDGGHILVTFKGEFSVGGTHIEAIGTRSSKDPFFKKYKYLGTGERRERVELPASEIDMGNVIKAAYSNMEVNGITRLLGLRNLTWADLQEYAKIKQSDTTSVEYKKEGKAPSSQAGKAPSSSQEKQEQKQPSSPDDPASLAQAQAIESILSKKGITDAHAQMQTVQSLLGLKEVPTAVASLTKSQASTVIGILQKEQKEVEGGEE